MTNEPKKTQTESGTETKTGEQHWSRSAITYQIYPMSFKDSNGDGKGDLGGILEKIDYLNGAQNSLGINAVWLCPFYPSPMLDFGYDVSDFTGVNSIFGDMETFERLSAELHKRGIKIIVDFVGNHTSILHKWFEESRSSKTNPKRDWYVWRDGDGRGGPPNNWVSVFSGSAWELDPKTGQYYFHSFLKGQPDLNWRNPEVRKAMMEVIDFWVEKGIDGFRVDAFVHFIEDDQFRDDPINPLYKKANDDPFGALTHIHSIGELDRASIVGDFFNEALAKHSEILIVSEAYVGPKDIRRIQEICQSERFTVFNFNFINKKWDALEYKRIIDEYLLDSPPYFLPNFVFGNHDVKRLMTRVGEAEARLTAFLQFTLPGMLFVYYGEEIGMTDGKIPHSALRDAISKVFIGFHGGRDPERTPMQWDDSPYAGFSTDKPWLPVNDNYKTINVAHAERDPQSMLSLYKNLIKLRNQIPALKLGQYVPLNSSSTEVFSFEVHHENERYFITMNFSANVQRELLPTDSKDPAIIFSTANQVSTSRLPRSIELMPFEGYVVKI